MAPQTRNDALGPLDEMISLSGGRFVMGSDRFYSEEAPSRQVEVAAFSIDRTPVTNRQFQNFVSATGHVTLAEIPPDPMHYPGLDPSDAVAGSAVFYKTDRPVALDDPSQWWHYVPGANWRHPAGPDSSLGGLDDHPVVHIAYADALAYANWCGKSLPTEAEWEYAARGGRDSEYAWGDDLAPDNNVYANYWQGLFPYANIRLDGWERTSPVGAFPANGFGLFDMIGNVWEWTADWYAVPASRKRKPQKAQRRINPSCCSVTVNPRGGTFHESFDPHMPDVRIGRKVLKGGSYLCAPNYCQRYRPAARHPQMVESPAGHIGFRCVRRLASARG